MKQSIILPTTYQFREMFTVTRDLPESTLREALRNFIPVENEIEEYLYGSVGTNEKITAHLEMRESDNQTWRPV